MVAAGARRTVCYVALDYPVRSQTFVTDEVAELRRGGVEVFVIALEGGDTDPDLPAPDLRVADRRARSPRVLAAAAWMALRRPGARWALRHGPLTLGLRVKLLAAAGAAERAGARAVHAHFAYRSADAAEIIGRVLATGHSVTAHARDLFVPEGDVARRLRTANTVVTVCDHNRAWLAAHHPDVVARTVVIPASTDVRDAPPTRPHRAVPTILTVGRLVDKKGVDTLLQACARLAHPWRLEVVGDGPLAPALQGLAADLGIADRVDFAGALDHGAVRAAMRRADVYCSAFRIAGDGDRDSMPVVVKEAMAAGLPVVSTDVVGVPEMVEHGRSGLLVAPDDPAALAGGLDRLLGDAALRAAMGARGREIAEARFDIRGQVDRLVTEVFRC